MTVAESHPDADNASSSVAVTSAAFIVVQSLPGHHVATVVIEDRAEVIPTPADDLQIGEVGLPQLVRAGGLVPELVGRLHHHEGRAGDQVSLLEDPVC